MVVEINSVRVLALMRRSRSFAIFPPPDAPISGMTAATLSSLSEQAADADECALPVPMSV
jgi:hypothetical protein